MKKRHNRGKSLASWRYNIVKGWIQRVQTFRRKATKLAEIDAWDKVEKWMRTILENRYQHNGNNRLPKRTMYMTEPKKSSTTGNEQNTRKSDQGGL